MENEVFLLFSKGLSVSACCTWVITERPLFALVHTRKTYPHLSAEMTLIFGELKGASAIPENREFQKWKLSFFHQTYIVDKF